MKFAKTLLAAAALVASVGANAQSVSVSAGPGSYTAPTPDDGIYTVQSTSVVNEYLAPLGATGTFLVVDTDGSATFYLNGADSFSFLWGSPDSSNVITFSNGVTYSGASLTADGYLTADSSNSNTVWVTFSDLEGIDSFTITTSQTSFEMAVAAPVPEPETYALMLAGLGAMAFVARRRKNS